MNSRQVKRRIRAHLAYWIPALGLSGWSITVRWSPRAMPVARKRNPAGLCQHQSDILQAVLMYNVRSMANLGYPERELEEVVVHELLHIVVVNGSERAVNTLAHALVELRRAPAHSWEEAA